MSVLVEVKPTRRVQRESDEVKNSRQMLLSEEQPSEADGLGNELSGAKRARPEVANRRK